MMWSGNRRGPANSFSLNRSTAKRTIAAARAAQSSRLVDLTFHCDGQSHTCLEPHAAVAHITGDKATVHASTQASQFLADRMKSVVGVGSAVVIAPHVGGGFGSKVGLGVETRVALALAKAAGKPVRIAFDRAEELSFPGHRPAAMLKVALLPSADGSLESLAIETQSNAGVAVNSIVSGLGRLMYPAKSKDLVDWDVVTNTPPGSPFRAPGGPTLAFALEQAVDDAALRLGQDAIDVRARWDDDPNRQRLYAHARALDLWRNRGAVSQDKGRLRRGVGVAAGYWLYFSQAGSEVELRIVRGRLIAAIGAQDMGQGARSVLAETVARAFALPVSMVEVEIGRSDLPPGPMAAGSRSTATIVPAALAAAEKLKGRLRAAARGQPRDNAPWAELIAAAPDMTIRAERPYDHATRQSDAKNPLKQSGMIGSVFDWMLRRFAHVSTGRGVAGAVQIAEVEVDTWLGRTRVVRFWSGLTIGKPQVPRLAISQAEGSIIQGIGYALYEGRAYDPASGHVLSAGLEDYRIPGIADTPAMTVYFDEAGFDHVPGGGIGIGEVATVPVAAAIANAMHHATGVRFTDSPMRPDRVLAALSRAGRV
jgi:xanthine dehydrogenase YagR molybdenum-binding subunit